MQENKYLYKFMDYNKVCFLSSTKIIKKNLNYIATGCLIFNVGQQHKF